jgi:hypothetical protein
MKTILILCAVVLTGCLCIPHTIETEELTLGMSYEDVIDIAEPYSETRRQEPGHVFRELRFTGGLTLKFKDDVLIEIEERL